MARSARAAGPPRISHYRSHGQQTPHGSDAPRIARAADPARLRLPTQRTGSGPARTWLISSDSPRTLPAHDSRQTPASERAPRAALRLAHTGEGGLFAPRPRWETTPLAVSVPLVHWHRSRLRKAASLEAPQQQDTRDAARVAAAQQ